MDKNLIQIAYMNANNHNQAELNMALNNPTYNPHFVDIDTELVKLTSILYQERPPYATK